MRRIVLLALLLAPACEEAPTVTAPTAPVFASSGKKPPSSTDLPSRTVVHDSWQNGSIETDVRSDGSGTYVDGQCGVGTWITVNSDGSSGARLYPGIESSSCPRRGTLRLANWHRGFNPDGTHDDVSAASLGEFAIREIKLLLHNGATVVNAPTRVDGLAGTSCFKVGRSGRISGMGLRFDAVNFPGSNSLVVTTLAPHSHYRVRTQAYPNNLAYCENDSGISFWHVVVDLEFQANSN